MWISLFFISDPSKTQWGFLQDVLDSSDRESSLELIKLDISRTFPQLCIFQQVSDRKPHEGYVQSVDAVMLNLIKQLSHVESCLRGREAHSWFFCLYWFSVDVQGGPYYDVLHSILGAYTCYRPDVGYVSPSKHFPTSCGEITSHLCHVGCLPSIYMWMTLRKMTNG